MTKMAFIFHNSSFFYEVTLKGIRQQSQKNLRENFNQRFDSLKEER